jgi:hypothetical protein
MAFFGEPGFQMIYSETFLAQADRWLLTEYQYNCLDLVRRRFFAYHHHPVPSVGGADASITHAHCRPLNAPSGQHFRSTWIDAVEAHWRYVTWAADSTRFPDCRALSPLVSARRRDRLSDLDAL